MRRRIAIAALAAALLECAVCRGQSDGDAKLNATIETLFAARTFLQVAISPDASRVAWVEGIPESPGDTIIRVAELKEATKPLRISAAPDYSKHAEGHVAWSPDSKQLAFLSDAGSVGQSQLYVTDFSRTGLRKLTNLTGFLDEPRWSPDGKSIALLFTENAPRATGPLEPMTVETGVIESKVYEQRISVVDTASLQVKTLSPADIYVYEYDWSPDGKSFALTAAHGAGDANWYVAQLYTLPVDSGEMKPIYKPSQQIAIPRWSPDGKTVAFIGGLMSDEGSTGGDIFVVPAGSGEARDVTPGIQASPSWLQWVGTDRIVLGEVVDGMTGLSMLEVSTGKITPLWSGPEVISTGGWGSYGTSLADDHKTSAVIRQSFSQPPEVWAGGIGQWRKLTNINDAVKPTWGEARNVHWQSTGSSVQGWLLFPVNYDAKQRYPMVVEAHGGPAAASLPTWPESFFNTSALSSVGYFVFYPNPRGSFGQGEAFTRGNVKDFGYGDFRDILAGVDQVERDLPVDPNRVGITGWSYGGYMTMWAVTQTQRFHAAVAGAGLANFQSYYGQNDIDEWMVPYFGASVYEDPAVYARSSPVTFIKNVKTPTLILVGDRDGEVPAPQSREFWHALKTLGVPTQLVIYPNEGHDISQADHQKDILRRTVGWFDRYLKAESGGPSDLSRSTR
jgi:dipeptidyl aminopeptidase/acylaminoacyl peptidase